MKVEEKINKTIKSNKSISNSFLDYDRRILEDDFILNKYFDNPNLSNLLRYLMYSFKALIEYIICYIKLTNISCKNIDYKIKFLLLSKCIISISLTSFKFITASLILLIIRIIITLYQQIFNILELILAPLIYKFSKKKRKLHKKLKNNNNNNSSNSKYSRNWKSLRDYYVYIIGKLIGKVRVNKKIVKPKTTLNLQNITFVKKLLIRSKQWIKLKMFNLRLINIINNNKNNIRKKNSKIQIKIIKKIIESRIKNKSKTNTKQPKRKLIKIIKNVIIKRIKKSKIVKPTLRIKYQIKQIAKKVVNVKTKIYNLEIKSETTLLNTLSIKTTKNLAKEIDKKTNLSNSQKEIFRQDDKKLEKINNQNKNNNKNDVILEKETNKQKNIIDNTNKKMKINEPNVLKSISTSKNEQTVSEYDDINTLLNEFDISEYEFDINQFDNKTENDLNRDEICNNEAIIYEETNIDIVSTSKTGMVSKINKSKGKGYQLF